MYNKIDFWWHEWKLAEKDSDLGWATICKEEYKFAVIESLNRPWNEYHEKLKQYPMVVLN